MSNFDHLKPVIDATSIGATVATLLGALPHIAAGLSVIWGLIRIYETQTFQNWLHSKPAKKKAAGKWLHPEWPNILKKAWSIRLMLLAGFFSGMEIGLPFLEGQLPVGRGTFAALAFVSTMAAFVTRLLAQSTFKDKQ